ncbi:MAG TPA: amidohydrolase family protein [Polyangiales bacterium]
MRVRWLSYLAVPLAWLAGCTCHAPAAVGAPATLAAVAVATVDPSLPKIDVHMHIAPSTSSLALQLMAAAGIRIGLNASGGYPEGGLSDSVALAQASQGHLLPYCNIRLSRAADADFAVYAHATLAACKTLGAVGLKIPKSLGLGAVGRDGRLLAVDDPVFDPLFEDAGKLGLPVLIHSGDPKAFFLPPTPNNERYQELLAHPAWSFYGLTPNGDPWPSWESLLDQFERRVARHPHTTFLGAHFGNAAEDPARVSRMLRAHPNLVIDTAARVPEFGRHSPSEMRAFFLEHQDRVLFGSDLAVNPDGLSLGSSGAEPDTLAGVPAFFLAHWLYFETSTRGLKHPTPIQGSWTVDGVGLPKVVLEKLYYRNAMRVFGLRLPER